MDESHMRPFDRFGTGKTSTRMRTAVRRCRRRRYYRHDPDIFSLAVASGARICAYDCDPWVYKSLTLQFNVCTMINSDVMHSTWASTCVGVHYSALRGGTQNMCMCTSHLISNVTRGRTAYFDIYALYLMLDLEVFRIFAE